MSCPTCHNTMGCIDGDREGESRTWFCNRCGTAVTEYSGDEPTIRVPALVEMCRGFLPAIRGESTVGGTVRLFEIRDIWHQLGIDDAIDQAEDQ